MRNPIKKFSQHSLIHLFHLVNDGLDLIRHVLLRSFLRIQIVVYQFSLLSAPSANLQQNVHTSLTTWQLMSEIGRKSLVISFGTLILGTEMISAFFHVAGTAKMPVEEKR